jgi:hypothetical protein
MMTQNEEEAAADASESPEPARQTKPPQDLGPAAAYHRSVAVTAASAAAVQAEGATYSESRGRQASTEATPVELPVDALAGTPQSTLGSSAAWRRIDTLPPGQRAIILSEIISKPIALRKDSSWL